MRGKFHPFAVILRIFVWTASKRLMNPAELKLELMRLIGDSDDVALLLQMRELLLGADLTEEEWAGLEEAIAAADRGELLPHDEVMKPYLARYGDD